MPIFSAAMVASAVVMTATVGGELLEGHNVSLPTVMAVGSFVFIGGRRLQKLEDRIIVMEKGIKLLPCHLNHPMPIIEDCKKDDS